MIFQIKKYVRQNLSLSKTTRAELIYLKRQKILKTGATLINTAKLQSGLSIKKQENLKMVMPMLHWI